MAFTVPKSANFNSADPIPAQSVELSGSVSLNSSTHIYVERSSGKLPVVGFAIPYPTNCILVKIGFPLMIY